jgi:large subunit ribosomal protein L23Ae
LIAAKAVQKGTNTTHKKKVRTTVHFFRPKTLIKARKPKYPRQAVNRDHSLDNYQVIKYPLTTERAMKKIEDNSNTLVFIVDKKANKKVIKYAVSQLYGVKALKVNTLLR